MAEPRLRTARTTDDVTIAWSEMGTGRTLVMAPTVPLSNIGGEMRIPFVAEASRQLAQRLRLIRYDGRGTGRSQRDVADLSHDAMLRDMDAVVDATGAERVAILGTYHACTIALAWAARHPDRVSGLILFGGTARTWDAMSDSRTQALLGLIDRDWDLFADTAAHAWLGWEAGETGRLLADSFRDATSPGIARATLEAARGLDVSGLLPAVSASVLVLHREGSTQMALQDSQTLAAALPHGHLLRLPGVAPALFYEHPAQDVQTVVRFVVEGTVERLADVIPARADGLTPREIEVLRLIAAGESNAEIAHRLGITVNTVERHAANLYRKIDARGRADATAWAVRHGIG